MIVPNVFCNSPSNKANIFEGQWSNFDQEKKDSAKDAEPHLQYKNHRNLLPTLEKSKENHCNKYFKSNWNNA